MFFVLPGILLIGIVLLICWAAFFRTAVQKEKGVQDERRRTDEIERLLDAPGEALFCVHCAIKLVGPLPALGCPECGSRSLVMPVRCLPPPYRVPTEAEKTTEATLAAPTAAHEGAAETQEALPQRNRAL